VLYPGDPPLGPLRAAIPVGQPLVAPLARG
jgi:hypothetical protein